ncbi:MAG TPA: bifunctional DNA primase/polymerase [Gemmataceae bacterium]|nr:bifunctional DNA primase/polymerase [Gemmataceae bacterium]
MLRPLKAVGLSGPTDDVLGFALAYARAGLSVIPIARDGSRAPPSRWKRFQTERADEQQLRRWFDLAEAPGLAIVCGEVSGGLEVIDFDEPASYPAWCELVEEQAPGLLNRLPVVQTPKGGAHVYYRCAAPDGNRKLASTLEGKTLIETRGEGGYVLAPGCPPECHPSGRLYVAADAAPDQAPKLDDAERELLLTAAASFNRRPRTGAEWDRPASGGRPGDDFNARATWEEILTPHGWMPMSQHGDKALWRRPGKAGRGWSATTGHCRTDAGDLLYVFSSNAAPFEPERSYSRFAAYTLLNHGGDYAAATRALGERGYGRPSRNGRHATAGVNGAARPPTESALSSRRSLSRSRRSL